MTKKIIMPSSEEGLARIKNTEIKKEILAVNDPKTGKKILIDKKEAPKEAFVTGRSAFWGVDLAKRLEFRINELDKVIQQQKECQETLNKINPKSDEERKKVESDLEKLNLKYEELHKFVCIEFHVPLDKEERKEISTYVKPTFIERIGSTSGLPVIASSSGTAGRPLIALYHFDFFNKGNEFDFDKARILSNCLFGVLVYGGHHTYIELVEPYNRLLDAAAIDYIEKNKGKDASQFIAKQVPVVQSGEVEDLLLFIHPSIRKSVEERMIKIEKDLEDSQVPKKNSI